MRFFCIVFASSLIKDFISASSSRRDEYIHVINQKLNQASPLPENKLMTHYRLNEEILSKLQGLGSNALKIILNPINQANFFGGYNPKKYLCLLDYIKFRLYQGDNSQLKIHGLNISPKLQRKIFLGLSLDEILNALFSNEESSHLNGKIEYYIHIFQRDNIRKKMDILILKWLRQFEKSTTIHLFLDPKIDNLINLYAGGGQTLDDYIKCQLYLGADPGLSLQNLTIAPSFQEAIFRDLHLDKILEIVIQASKLKNIGMQTPKPILLWARQRFGELMVSWLKRFKSTTIQVLLSPENKELFEFYVGNGQSLENQIKSRLFLPDFFPLKNTGAKISQHIQSEIFALFNLDEIFEALVNSGYKEGLSIRKFLESNYDSIMHVLRELVLQRHQQELIEILKKIVGLEYQVSSILFFPNYNELCQFIKTVIFQGIFSQLDNLDDISSYCPQNFLLFKELTIPRDKQETIFGLLDLHQIYSVLVNCSDCSPSQNNILNLLETSKVIEMLRDLVITTHMYKVLDILKDIRGLERLGVNNGYHLIVQNYAELCKVVSKSIFYMKFKEQVDHLNGNNISLWCPKNFFSLEDTGFKVDESKQLDIFRLLDKNQIATIFYQYKDYVDFDLGVQAVIENNSLIMGELRNLVIKTHLTRTLRILEKAIKMPLPTEIVTEDFDWSYAGLIEFISLKAKFYKKFEEQLFEIEDVSQLCPRGFFPLENTGLDMRPHVQDRIFMQLDTIQLFTVFFKYRNSINLDQGIKTVIESNIEVMKELRDLVVATRAGLLWIVLKSEIMFDMILSLGWGDGIPSSYERLREKIIATQKRN